MPQKKRDAVHRYFEFDEATNISSCQLCNNKLKGKHATNMKNHLAAKHLEEFQLIKDLNKDMEVQSASNSSAISTPPSATEKIKHICTRLVTVHGRPLAMMEDKAFKELVDMAGSSSEAHKNTNIKAIKHSVTDYAKEIRKKIASETKNQLINLKLDAVTCQERKFIGVNIQYIIDARITIRNLAVIEIFNRQTANFLKTTVEEILSDFKISKEQLYCVCTDNGSNMIKMVKNLGGKYCTEDEDRIHENNEDENNEEDDSDDDNEDDESMNNINIMNDFFYDFDLENFITNDSFQVRGMLCAVHTLQLAVKDAINESIMAQTTINVARRISKILRNPNNSNLIKAAGLKKPVKDCPTRWSSTFNMLQRLLTLSDFCKSNAEVASLVSDRFWDEVRMLLMVLKPANDATIILQKQQLTVGDFFITWYNCKNEINSINNEFAFALLEFMEQRQIKLLQNDVILEGLYLDGRLNIVLSAEQCQKARYLLKDVLQQILRLKEIQSETDTVEPIMPNVNEPCTSRVSDLEQMLINTERARGLSGSRQIRTFDVSLCEVLSAPRLALTENILVHWNNKTVSTAELAMVARVVLAAPMTQVSVERLFSSLKFILNPLRSNLSASSLKDILIIRENKDLL